VTIILKRIKNGKVTIILRQREYFYLLNFNPLNYFTNCN